MSWTFSERLMYVQFTSCVYGEVNYRNTRKRCEIFSLLFYCFWKVIYPDDQNIQVEFEYSSPPVLTWDVFMSLGVAVNNDFPKYLHPNYHQSIATSRRSHQRCSMKKVFSELLQNSQGNTLRTSFLQNPSGRLLLDFLVIIQQ